MNKRAKYRLICQAPSYLTTYNEEVNREVKAHCERGEKFNPTIQCVKYGEDFHACKYLEIKRLS